MQEENTRYDNSNIVILREVFADYRRNLKEQFKWRNECIFNGSSMRVMKKDEERVTHQYAPYINQIIE